MAIDEKIYTCPVSSPLTWNLAYSYPVGIEINVLFYDELLVGTSTGLYAQDLETSSVSVNNQLTQSDDKVAILFGEGVIHVTANFVIQNIEVFDLGGRLVYREIPKERNISFNQNLKGGVYIVNTTNKLGITHSNKIAITQSK